MEEGNLHKKGTGLYRSKINPQIKGTLLPQSQPGHAFTPSASNYTYFCVITQLL